MKEISAVITWFMEIVKSFENLKHLCCSVCYGSCFLLHSSLGSLKQFNLMFLEVYFWQSSPVLGRLHDH